MISANELARRICVARHPFMYQTGAAVPCAEDTRTAQLSYGLMSEVGTAAFSEMARARVEDGLDPDMPALINEGIEAFRLTREYIGPFALPAEPGWSWFDWTEKAAKMTGWRTVHTFDDCHLYPDDHTEADHATPPVTEAVP